MKIANKYKEIPFDSGVKATMTELQDAGFMPGMPNEDTPGLMPEEEIILEPGVQTVQMETMAAIMARSSFRVLRDEDENIVANWDEGRWWTPEESTAFIKLIQRDILSGVQTPRGGYDA